MKQFLKSIFLFTLGALALLGGMVFFSNHVVSSKSNFTNPISPNNLIVGHSHAECTYNDALISSTWNIATSGESYFNTYVKLREVLSENKNISSVFLEFTNNQIEKDMDNWIFGDKYISKFYPKFGPFYTWEQQSILFKNNLRSFLKNLGIEQKRNMYSLFSEEIMMWNDIGGYVHYPEKDLNKAIQRELRKAPYVFSGISELNLLYLKKTVDLCLTKNITVILLRSPQHELLRARGNEKIFMEMYWENYSNLPFVDFNNYQLPEDYYKDLGHLNYLGAEVISRKLDSLIRYGIIDSLLKTNNKHLKIYKERN